MADISIHDIAVKQMSDEDSSGDIWFAVKVTVTNPGPDAIDVRIDLQALDDDGFEVKDVSLRGQVGPGESKSITDRSYMQLNEFVEIGQWQVKGHRFYEL